ncbi:MAG TPA: L-glutamate gamma-semialdehyde dehydrogenase [Ignavibacteriales bacterium]|nr:L-glutamate gamma-semialdehyde dehydrogenase [Ignavibacteriales bacterium]
MKDIMTKQGEHIIDFSKEDAYKKQVNALKQVRQKLGQTYEIVINGENIKTEQTFNSYNPSNKEEIIGTFYKGTKELADRAIKEAAKKFETWKDVPAEKRASYLFKAAEICRKKRYEINAWMILEAGKNFTEADADTAEAIDFLEFYGREALRYAKEQPITPVKGEKNKLVYIPLGVGVAVPPWNFPFAILTGITSAAIVAGNTVVLKPSSDTPMMGKLFNDIMKQAGLPAGVLNFMPGSGAEVGDTLVAHPLTRFVSFTGSVGVGVHINELAAKVQPGQIWLKRVVAEMGGKDNIVVDKDLHNFDETVKGVVASAFGFQGQKCSACSRVIVHSKIYDKFTAKLKEEVEKLDVGPAEENHKAGPVVNAAAEKNILEYIRIAKEEGAQLLTGGEKADDKGYYIKPTVFIDVKPDATIAQEEIFGPVLAVIKADDFNQALEIANNTKYGLTGAVYAKDKKKLELASKKFHVGNLYLNRKCTGALVGGHPFGGFNMSGTDSKAGGRDYLMLFMQAKVVSDKQISK